MCFRSRGTFRHGRRRVARGERSSPFEKRNDPGGFHRPEKKEKKKKNSCFSLTSCEFNPLEMCALYDCTFTTDGGVSLERAMSRNRSIARFAILSGAGKERKKKRRKAHSRSEVVSRTRSHYTHGNDIRNTRGWANLGAICVRSAHIAGLESA